MSRLAPPDAFREVHTLEYGNRESGAVLGYIKDKMTNLRVHGRGWCAAGYWRMEIEFFVIIREHGVEERRTLTYQNIESKDKAELLDRAGSIIDLIGESWCKP